MLLDTLGVRVRVFLWALVMGLVYSGEVSSMGRYLVCRYGGVQLGGPS